MSYPDYLLESLYNSLGPFGKFIFKVIVVLINAVFIIGLLANVYLWIF